MPENNIWGIINPLEDVQDINGYEYRPIYEKYKDASDLQAHCSVMKHITSYEDFVLYCLRKLGAPLINIEVADEQIRDRITDALQFYLENHIDSVEGFWFCYKINERDLKQKYIQMPPHILDVLDVQAHGGGSLGGYDVDPTNTMDTDAWLMSPTFGFMTGWVNTLTGFGNFSNNSIVYYELMMQELALLKDVMTAEVAYSWRNREKKLYLYGEMKQQIILIHANQMLDPDNDQQIIFDAPWLKSYATCLIGLQWAQNLSKFGNINAGGGLTINADNLLTRFTEEKRTLEENFIWKQAAQPLPKWA